VQWQNDARLERENCIEPTPTPACPQTGTLRGGLRKDQRELVTGVGPYLRGELAVTPSLLASAGVRADAVRFEVQDHLVTATNPDDSGDRTLHAVSPAVGLVWRTSPLASVYANLSSSFETPTTTELGNKPDGTAGINPELQPQRTITGEIGAKGVLPGAPVRWDVALFEARARDELVPFDIVNGGGRRYFRNAGRTVRRGGELGLEAEAGRVTVHGAYTYSHFRYVDYAVGTTSYAGNRIPGVPEQALALTASLRQGPLTLSTTADLSSPVEVDDANSARAPGRAIFGLGLGADIHAGSVRIAPLVAVQNLGGVRSVGSVSVNATGGKFYEPAPGRTLVVRLSVSRRE
jgi:iron complex outermembrane recepter protein